jgi:hypothetical protein
LTVSSAQDRLNPEDAEFPRLAAAAGFECQSVRLQPREGVVGHYKLLELRLSE